MFGKKKLQVSLIESNWASIKRNIVFKKIPRTGEYIYLDGQYYNVLNIVHTLEKEHNIFVVVEKIATFNPSIMTELTNNEVVKK